ncbi:MAG: hypothetical protein NVS9B7_24530 [Flavisolibacter sp.]
MKTLRVLSIIVGISLILYNISQWMLYPPVMQQTDPEARLHAYIMYDLYFIIGIFLLFIAWIITKIRNKEKRKNKFIRSIPE